LLGGLKDLAKQAEILDKEQGFKTHIIKTRERLCSVTL
jgi:hypothetical protein